MNMYVLFGAAIRNDLRNAYVKQFGDVPWIQAWDLVRRPVAMVGVHAQLIGWELEDR